VESELILLGTDYDKEGKPIAYFGREQGRELRFAGTAFLALSSEVRRALQGRMARQAASAGRYSGDQRPPISVRGEQDTNWIQRCNAFLAGRPWTIANNDGQFLIPDDPRWNVRFEQPIGRESLSHFNSPMTLHQI
jgi:hypothetical protein